MSEPEVRIIAKPEDIIIDKTEGIVEIRNATIRADGLFGEMLISANEQTIAKWVVNHKDTWDIRDTLAVMIATELQVFHKTNAHEGPFGKVKRRGMR